MLFKDQIKLLCRFVSESIGLDIKYKNSYIVELHKYEDEHLEIEDTYTVEHFMKKFWFVLKEHELSNVVISFILSCKSNSEEKNNE